MTNPIYNLVCFSPISQGTDDKAADEKDTDDKDKDDKDKKDSKSDRKRDRRFVFGYVEGGAGIFCVCVYVRENDT